uniref:Uncharacterized protein n=1 Tax=Sciurus vulgaris TaxID=55149 RepID=A0A8D2JSX4_SCIVU
MSLLIFFDFPMKPDNQVHQETWVGMGLLSFFVYLIMSDDKTSRVLKSSSLAHAHGHHEPALPEGHMR